MRILLVVGAVAGVLAGAIPSGHAADAQVAGAGHKSPWRWLGPFAPDAAPLPDVPKLLDRDGHAWTIEEALARALEANPDVQVALANVQHQAGVQLQSTALLLPRIGITGTADWRDPAMIDRSPDEITREHSGQSVTPITTRGYSAQVEMRETVFDGFASWAQVKRASLMKKKAAVDARDTYLKVASQVRQAFDAVLIRQAFLKTRRDGAHDMAHLAEVAKKRFQAGEISEYESLRAEAAQRSAEADLAQAQADLTKSEATFCGMLYIAQPADGLKLAGTVEPVQFHETFDSALFRAKRDRLDLKSAELQLEAANRAVAVTARSGLLPRIDAYVNYGTRSSYYDVNRQLDGWSLGLTGNWNIFDSGQTLGNIRTQRADRRAAEIRLADTQRQIGADVHQLFAGLSQTKSVLDSQATARDLAERSVREARKLYEVGRVSLEEILNTEMAYRQALLGWLGAVYSYNATVYQLDYATSNDAFLDAVTKKQ